VVNLFRNNSKPAVKPCRFAEEHHSYAKDDRFKKIPKTDSQTNTIFIGSDSSLFNEGDTVEHERFGKGVIRSIEGQPPNTTATVEFVKEGSKKLLLRFAKLKKL